MAGWVRGLTACFLSGRGNRIAGMRRPFQIRIDVALRSPTNSRALLEGYKALLFDVNGIKTGGWIEGCPWEF